MIDFDKIQVGDKVRCVNDDGWAFAFREGEVYTVTEKMQTSGGVRLNGRRGPQCVILNMGDFEPVETNETDQRIANLKREIEALERAREAEAKQPEQWEPVGGGYTITSTEEVMALHSAEKYRLAGAERPTREQAERAAEKMRIHNRAQAYVDEHAPDYVFYVGDAYRVEYKCGYDSSQGWEVMPAICRPIGAVIGPKWVMEKLADDLNSGRVNL